MKPFPFPASSRTLSLAASFLLLALTACQTKSKDEPASAADRPSLTAVPTTPAAPARVTTLPSGLRYLVQASGPANGRSPSYNDSVSVHYTGTLTDGTVFDSSIQRGEPATFGVSQVITGWTEALQLMKPGDKWLIFIPSNLAYGSRAVGGKIPPNSDLIFQVELLSIVKR